MLRHSIISGDAAFNLVVSMLRDHKMETLNELVIANEKLTAKQVKEIIADPKFLAELIDGERGLRKKLEDLTAKYSATEIDSKSEADIAPKLAVLQKEFIEVLDFCFKHGLDVKQEYKEDTLLIEIMTKEFVLPEVVEKLLSEGASRNKFSEAVAELKTSLQYTHSSSFELRIAMTPEKFPLSIRMEEDLPFQKFEKLCQKYPVVQSTLNA